MCFRQSAEKAYERYDLTGPVQKNYLRVTNEGVVFARMPEGHIGLSRGGISFASTFTNNPVCDLDRTGQHVAVYPPRGAGRAGSTTGAATNATARARGRKDPPGPTRFPRRAD